MAAAVTAVARTATVAAMAAATTVAVRRESVSSAISPKKSPARSMTDPVGSLTSTAPAMMKYIQSARSPWWTIVSPGTATWGCSTAAISAMRVAGRFSKNGTPATRFQA